MRKVVQYTYLLFNELLFGRSNTKYTGSGVRKRINLTTGGFVEIERSKDADVGIGYVRIHLGKPKRAHDLNETYKYIQYGTNWDNLGLLTEISTAVMLLSDELRP